MVLQEQGELERMRGALDAATRQGEHNRATIEALRSAVDEQRREAQHQFRNILSVVRSIARRTAEEGEATEDYQARLDSRLASFTRLQSQILRNPTGGVDLCTLISDELLAFEIRSGAEAHVEGTDICLYPKAASVLGLAIHELACLAIGGGSAIADGRITVHWRTEKEGDGADYLLIEWTESGRTAKSGTVPDATFGREFLEQAVSYELGGSVRLDAIDDSLLCRFRVPIEGIVVT